MTKQIFPKLSLRLPPIRQFLLSTLLYITLGAVASSLLLSSSIFHAAFLVFNIDTTVCCGLRSPGTRSTRCTLRDGGQASTDSPRSCLVCSWFWVCCPCVRVSPQRSLPHALCLAGTGKERCAYDFKWWITACCSAVGGSCVCTGSIQVSDPRKVGLLMNMVPVVLRVLIIYGLGSIVFDFEDPFPCVHRLLRVG